MPGLLGKCCAVAVCIYTGLPVAAADTGCTAPGDPLCGATKQQGMELEHGDAPSLLQVKAKDSANGSSRAVPSDLQACESVLEAGGKCCANDEGTYFACGAGSTCCHGVCAAPGSTCCKNIQGYGFPCAGTSSCCGNSCMAPGSDCCAGNANLPPYPVAKGTECIGGDMTDETTTTDETGPTENVSVA